ncbi:MAG: 30S ribosomal protein S25e [Candidatus Verstraetearchaeota archaeon]|nr:30S ribosomal protein S25e [Candidatus Verstraetearchaeota archaeon]
MGGAKKTVAKPAKDAEAEKKKEAAAKKEIQKSAATSVVDQKILDQLRKEVPKLPCVTPYQLYSKYNLKYSVAKDVLENMVKQGVLKQVKKTRRVDIYAPAA